MRFTDRLLENSLIYSLWQRPFIEQKLMPLFKRPDLSRAVRVLDVGCGPAINTRHFARARDYLGIDINPAYIASARQQYNRNFIVADVTTFSGPAEQRFDFVFTNSLLHHIDDVGVGRLLRQLSSLVSDNGFVHIIDLVVPEKRRSIAGQLTAMDRGNFARPLVKLRSLVAQNLEIVESEEYTLHAFGRTFWCFVYFKTRRKSNDQESRERAI